MRDDRGLRCCTPVPPERSGGRFGADVSSLMFQFCFRVAPTHRWCRRKNHRVVGEIIVTNKTFYRRQI